MKRIHPRCNNGNVIDAHGSRRTKNRSEISHITWVYQHNMRRIFLKVLRILIKHTDDKAVFLIGKSCYLLIRNSYRNLMLSA